MITYEFTDANKAHAFHAEASQVGPVKWGGLITGWYPDTWSVGVSAEFDAMVELRKSQVPA